jgi:hypothetical protein
MSHWCEMPAPEWARAVASESIRERDCEPCALYPPTPREEDSSLDDLLYWLRAAERFIQAVTNGWVHKRDWTYWCRIFERIPCVNAHFAALLPRALEARRLRREHARAEAAQRGKLESHPRPSPRRQGPMGAFWPRLGVEKLRLS